MVIAAALARLCHIQNKPKRAELLAPPFYADGL